MRIVAIVSNVLVLGFVLWMELESVKFASSVGMPPLRNIGVLIGRLVFVGFTIIPTMIALVREQPRVESYAIIVNIVLWFGLVAGLAVLAISMFLPGTDHKLVLLVLIPAICFLVPISLNVVVLRQRRAARSQKLAGPAL